jgi:hypothetical protein
MAASRLRCLENFTARSYTHAPILLLSTRVACYNSAWGMWTVRISMRDDRSLAVVWCTFRLSEHDLRKLKWRESRDCSIMQSLNIPSKTDRQTQVMGTRTEFSEPRKLMITETIPYCLTNMISNDPHRARMVQRGTITRSLLKLYTLQKKKRKGCARWIAIILRTVHTKRLQLCSEHIPTRIQRYRMA